MKESVLIDGVLYSRVNQEGEERRIVVVDNRGLTFVGHIKLPTTETYAIIRDAQCIIRWGTVGHLAELAESGPLPNTKLGHMRDVRINPQSIILDYLCSEKWDEDEGPG